jgi:hypothetical protein
MKMTAQRIGNSFEVDGEDGRLIGDSFLDAVTVSIGPAAATHRRPINL